MNDQNAEIILNSINSMKNDINSIQNNVNLMQNSISSMQNTISSMQNSINARLDLLDRRLDSHDENFSAINRRLDSHDENFKDIKQELTSLGNIVTRMETDLGCKTQIGLEYASISMEKFDNLQKTVDNINSKLDTHDLQIEVLEEKVL